MPVFLIFPSQAAATAHANNLARGIAFTNNGDLDLPRCDCGGLCPGDHSGADVQRGSKTECICTTRETPNLACPYITVDAVEVVPVGSGFGVQVSSAHVRANINTNAARALTEIEIVAAVPL